MDFIKNALREFRHVVWPTRDETKKYFTIVLAVLCAFGLYLFIVGNIFSEILFGLKEMVNPSVTNTADISLPEGLEGLSVQTGATNEVGRSFIPDVTSETITTDLETEAVEVQ